MNFKIINNYVDPEECKNLLKDAELHSNLDNYEMMHGNRRYLMCSSLEFYNLCNNSESWSKLQEKLSSQEFFDYCCSELNLDSNKFVIKNHFKQFKLNEHEKLFKSISNKKTKLLNNKTLIKFILYRIYKRIIRKIKYSKIFYLKKKPVELLYDYSIAGDGYKREIHRDSDNRVIVFLLYLNKMDQNSVGGNLEIFKLKKEVENPPALPNKEECEIIKSIVPEPGKLIIFENNNLSYHNVSKIENSKSSRNFIYGSFTILQGKNTLITTKSKLNTEFFLYE